jgi:hypothetical protein
MLVSLKCHSLSSSSLVCHELSEISQDGKCQCQRESVADCFGTRSCSNPNDASLNEQGLDSYN